MFAEKSIFPSSNHLHLPSIGQSLGRRIRPPPTPLFTSRAAKAAHIAENVSALKAKYTDYNTWLKTSTRPNHEPALTQDLLKHSLCQMGIDTGKAEQLVSTCSWYVYQFEKDLKRDSTECSYSPDKKTPRLEKLKFKKTMTLSDSTEDSITPINSLVQDDSSSHHRRHFPSISITDSRRVDFDDDRMKFKAPITKRIRLKPIPVDPSTSPPASSVHSSASSRNFRRHGLAALGQTRSILRKKDSISSSTLSQVKTRSSISSTIADEIPLGTRSQRLFGGSEYFAQIMNELEEQEL